ncbi:MAG: alanine/ornithine racemase family PLP-dependent enzyme [Bacteroidia bacterium]
MAFLTLYRDRLRHNYDFLDKLFSENQVAWGVVTKMLCGNRAYIQEVLDLGPKEISDSRISNLQVIKKLKPEVQTVYIKPPPIRSIQRLVKYADVSFNTEFSTIKALSEEAQRQKKIHKVIIMIEMGDLREGVMGDNLVNFYNRVFELPGIEVIGIGTNLNCLHGIMPSQDKLIQLSLYKQIIDLKFNTKIPWITGGSSVTIPLLLRNQLPKGVNHFRIGETLYFGLDLFTSEVIDGMKPDVFELCVEIIELIEKPMLPSGELGYNPQGEQLEFDDTLYGKTSHRAIVDIGVLDVDPKYLVPKNDDFEIVGASSDMLVVDLGQNESRFKVGDLLKFDLKYMGALALLNSNYIEKRIS